jgi:hypothetical protein
VRYYVELLIDYFINFPSKENFKHLQIYSNLYKQETCNLLYLLLKDFEILNLKTVKLITDIKSFEDLVLDKERMISLKPEELKMECENNKMNKSLARSFVNVKHS